MLKTSTVVTSAALAAIAALTAVVPLQAAANARAGAHMPHVSGFPTPRPQPTCGPPVNALGKVNISHACPV